MGGKQLEIRCRNCGDETRSESLVRKYENSAKTPHSNLEYSGFVSSLSDDDYFVKEDTVVFRIKKLREMLEKDEIYAVKRNYGDGGGFNRIR